MRHDFIDRYSRLHSPIHGIPAGAKLAGAIMLVVATVSVPATLPAFFLAVTGFLTVVLFLSKIPVAFVLKRILFLEPFIVGLAVLTLLQPNGIQMFLSIMVKSTLCLSTMVLLSNTTPFADLLQLLKRLGTPAIIVTTLALMYRYLFVLIDETERMQRARRSRTFTARQARTWSAIATTIAQLFVRSTERAERIYAAMCARGWT